MLCTDIGGTSFDIALITDGRFEITQTPDIARFVLAMPLVKIDSIGAGTGSFVRVNPNSNRPELGPDSAGSRIGVCWPEGGLDTVSVTDLNLVLGRDQPGLLPRRRRRSSTPSGLAPRSSARSPSRSGSSVEDAAAGVVELFEQTLRNEAVGRILGKGYSPADYALLCYGGGGPAARRRLHRGRALPRRAGAGLGGRVLGLRLRLRAFEYRYDQTIDMPIGAGGAEVDEMEKAGIGMMVTGAWLGLQEKVAEEFAKSGVAREAIEFGHAVRMQYYGQLNDIEIVSPQMELEEGAHVDELIAAFEEAYGKVYARSARSPELGYLITHAIVTGSVPVETPALPDLEEPTEGAPPEKDTRPAHWGGRLRRDRRSTSSSEVRAGHEIAGPAIVESVATTLAIPPGRSARLDHHQIFHLTRNGGLSMAIVDATTRAGAGGAADRLGRAQRSSRCSTSPSGCSPRPAPTRGSRGDLALKDSDPIGYEKLFARLRGGLVSARETALNISASPIVRELGELCFALYTPEGDSIALSHRDHRPRPHDVGRDQVHGPLRLRGRTR